MCEKTQYIEDWPAGVTYAYRFDFSYFYKRSDHMICISVIHLIESILLWTVWSHGVYFCQWFDWVHISVNGLIIWFVFLWSIWLSHYFCKRFDHMICISLNDLTDRVRISVNDFITWSVFLWTIWLSPYFCKRLDHMACLSVNDLTESLFVWAIWMSLYFCERFNTWSVFLSKIWLS